METHQSDYFLPHKFMRIIDQGIEEAAHQIAAVLELLSSLVLDSHLHARPTKPLLKAIS